MFDDRSIDEIADDEFHDAVTTGAREQQHLEFKATLRLSGDKQQIDKEKLEMLLDVAAMANGGGGHILYGVTDDGNAGPGGYFGLTLDDAKKIETTIDELCVVHISERIDGLQVRVREIRGNYLVVVRPPSSAKAPHMVTFNGSTTFVIRHDDNKRKMTIGEIRSAFNDDLFGRRLSRVEQELSQVLEYIKHAANDTVGAAPAVSSPTAEDGNLLSEERRKAVWERYE